MEKLFLILAIWLTPIALIGLILYLAMKKGQTIEDFVDKHDLNEPDFWSPLFIPGVGCIVCVVTIAHFIFKAIKHWKK